MIIYHRSLYVYIVFQNQEAAAKVFKDRYVFELKLEKYDVSIQNLNESFWKQVERFENPENVLAIVKPLSPLDVVQDLPKN